MDGSTFLLYLFVPEPRQKTSNPMRKKLFLLALLVFALCSISKAQNYDFSAVTSSGHTLYYKIYSSCVHVTNPNWFSCTPPSGALVIDSTVTWGSTTYTVTSIGGNAFGDCILLTSVSIPNTVTRIGNRAFVNCTRLTSVNIPDSVTSIEEYTFFRCIRLTSVIIGNSVTNIASNAFSYCSEITSIVIPNSVTSIGNGAFSDCSGLTEITCQGTVAPIVETSTFTGVESTIPVNIPCGSAMSYYSRWNYFSNFIEDVGFIFETATADSSMGNVKVLAQPTCQAPIAVIHAVPNEGHHFTNWSDGITENPRSLVLTQDTSIIAYFSSSNGIVNSDESGQIPNVYAEGGKIVLTGAEGEEVCLYDMTGRLLATRQGVGVHGCTPLRFDVPTVGVYLVRVGNHPARRIVIVR